jgi:hypothetical protein
MPIIGRLDEQTEAILIKPLEKRDAHKPGQATEDERPPGAAEHSTPSMKIMPRDEESSRDKPKARDALPVWLL